MANTTKRNRVQDVFIPALAEKHHRVTEHATEFGRYQANHELELFRDVPDFWRVFSDEEINTPWAWTATTPTGVRKLNLVVMASKGLNLKRRYFCHELH